MLEKKNVFNGIRYTDFGKLRVILIRHCIVLWPEKFFTTRTSSAADASQ